MSTMTLVGKTTNYDVYFGPDMRGNLHFYFEHNVRGDADGQVAIVDKNRKVIDLDMCGALGREPAAYLRNIGIDTDGAAVDDP